MLSLVTFSEFALNAFKTLNNIELFPTNWLDCFVGGGVHC